MTLANKTKVLIGGSVYTLSGDESEEYIQRVALYINNKLDEIKNSENAKQLNTRLMSVLLEVNIADDYFKAKDRILKLEETIRIKDMDISKEQQEKVRLNTEIDTLNAEIDGMRETIDGLKREIESYKAELNEYIEMFDANS